jgi:ABC-type sugar transport system permease subunit
VTHLSRKKVDIWPYLLIAPALIIILAVVFIPAIHAISMSFQNYDLTKPTEIGFAGLKNYIEIFKDGLFWSSPFENGFVGNLWRWVSVCFWISSRTAFKQTIQRQRRSPCH